MTSNSNDCITPTTSKYYSLSGLNELKATLQKIKTATVQQFMKHTIAIGCRATRGSSIRRIICEDSQTQSCRSTFNGFCKGSSRTIFRRFGDGSGSKSASLLSVSLPEDSDDLSKQKSIFLLASVSLTFVDV